MLGLGFFFDTFAQFNDVLHNIFVSALQLVSYFYYQ